MGKHVFTRVCLGNKPSHVIADRCMIKIASCGSDKYPFASICILYIRVLMCQILSEGEMRLLNY